MLKGENSRLAGAGRLPGTERGKRSRKTALALVLAAVLSGFPLAAQVAEAATTITGNSSGVVTIDNNNVTTGSSSGETSESTNVIVYGRYSDTTAASKGSVTISNSTFESTYNSITVESTAKNYYNNTLIYGGYSNVGNVSNNTVIVSYSTFNNIKSSSSNIEDYKGYTKDEKSSYKSVQIIGGYSSTGNVSNNIVTVSNCTLYNTDSTYGMFRIFGGLNDGDGDGDVYSNSVTITNLESNTYLLITGGQTEENSKGNVYSNSVTITSGTFSHTFQVYGGRAYQTNGDAYKNIVNIEGGTFTVTGGYRLAVYGGASDNGDAYENTVTISGGTFTDSTGFGIQIAGGLAAQKTGAIATNNTVNLLGGTFTCDGNMTIYGGHSASSTKGDITSGNTLNISSKVTFNSTTTAYNFEKINFLDKGTYTFNVSTTDSSRDDKTVTTTLATGSNDVTLSGNITNGTYTCTCTSQSTSYAITLNITKTGSGTLTLSGDNTYTGSTTIEAGILSLLNAEALSDGVDDGSDTTTYGSNGLYTVNSGAILDFAFTEDGTVNNSIDGAGNVTVNAESNDVEVTFSGDYTYTGRTYVYTGILNAENAKSFSSPYLYIYGGATFVAPNSTEYNFTYSPTTLIADASNGSSVHYVNDLVMAEGSSLKIYGPANVNAEALLLVEEGSATLDGVSYSYTATGAVPLLEIGDKIHLINATGVLSADGATGTYNVMTGTTITYDWQQEVLEDDGELNIIVTGVKAAPQAESLLEGNLAASALVNQGADMVAGRGIEAAVAATQAIREPGKIAFTPFATIQGATMRYNSGSHIDMQSMNLLAGLATGFNTTAGDLALGAFFEYGTGSYSTYNSFNTGSYDGAGDMYSVGWGILGRMDFLDMGMGHFYVEASGRMGGLYNTYENQDMRDYVGRSAEYDRYSAYYSFHAALGYIFDFMEAAHLDVYGKYFWTRVDGEELTLSTGDELEFDDVTSSRLRFGTRFTYDVNEKVSPYIGFAYEHEFDGKARGTTYGYDISSPSLKGDTGIGEIGISLKPSELPIELDFTVQGHVGKREGVMGTVFFKYTF